MRKKPRRARSAGKFTASDARGLSACELAVETSNLAACWRHSLALDGFTRAVPLSTQGELHGDQHPARTLRLSLASGHLVGGRDQDVSTHIRTRNRGTVSAFQALRLDSRQAPVHGLSGPGRPGGRRAIPGRERPGTRIFIRQLVEMHAANLRLESQNMRLVGELCNALESMVDASTDSHDRGDLP